MKINRKQQKVLKVVTWTIGIFLMGYIVGPALYWHLINGLTSVTHRSFVPCPPCRCDCSQQPLLSLTDEPKPNNDSFTDCMNHDADENEEKEKSFSNLLAEEIRLKEAQSHEKQRRADMLLLEVKKMASQYQKEADKCSSGMETCEEARETAEEILAEQKSLSQMWELRARQQGWREDLPLQ